ncbi:MAG: glycosyltransferase [Flavobacteriales bacterium]|nr:glycosyltransferase [Flavobacteriales bacterium]
MSSQKLHILFISTAYPGPYQPLEGVFFTDQAQALAKAGHKVGYIAINPVSIKDIFKKGLSGLGKKTEENKGVHTFIFRYPHTPKDTQQPIRKALKKGKVLAEEYLQQYGKPDIVHLHRFEGGLLAVYFKEKYNIPYVVTEHSSRFLNGTLPQNQLTPALKTFSESAENIAVSRAFKEKLESITGKTFTYLPNMVDTEAFSLGKKSKKGFILLSVGNFTPNKRQDLAVHAFANFCKIYPETSLWMIGEGPEKSTVQKLVEELGISDQVQFKGRISREELAQCMKQAHVLLITSKVETFGVVAIEALSSGIPVISTRCGGPESVIKEGESGYFSDANVDAYVQTMLKCKENYGHFTPEELRKKALEEFSSVEIVRKLENIYRKYI